MAKISRLGGSLLLEDQGKFFLVGNSKCPCDFEAAGFEDPGTIDAMQRHHISLKLRGPFEHSKPLLTFEAKVEDLPSEVYSRMVIYRNASVSERLWDLILGADEWGDLPDDLDTVNAQWLFDMPETIWAIVRDQVLRCS